MGLIGVFNVISKASILDLFARSSIFSLFSKLSKSLLLELILKDNLA
jgi:hypothetical protein